MMLRMQPGDEGRAPARSIAFGLSLGVHAVVIAALAFLPPFPPASRTPVLDELVRPYVRQVLIYDARTLPRLAQPEKQIGDSPKPAGEVQARRVVIANSPVPKSENQFVWQPAPKLEAPRDVETPDIVARLARIAPPVPPPPEPPKPEPPQSEQPKPEPRVEKRTPKLFEHPKPKVSEPKLPVETAFSEPPPPGGGAPKVDFRGVAPSTAAIPAPPSPGNATADLAVVSTRPGAGTEAPAGERPGRFSRAPTVGEPSSGRGDPRAPVVPNLASSGAPGTVPPPPPKPVVPKESPTGRPVLYQERIRSVSVATLSVPLRPAARTVPRSVDARFRGRTVYAVVIPFENFPAYTGDWILWFAEKDPLAEESPVVRAPVPLRKIEVAGPAPAVRPERAQVTAILTREGRLREITVLTLAAVARSSEIIRDLEAWEFRPATRNGSPVDAEVIFEIVFNLPSNPANPSQQ